jgi:hypothetical protein
MIASFGIVVLMLGFVAGCASPSANKGNVFKAGEMQGDAFSSSVSGH